MCCFYLTMLTVVLQGPTEEHLGEVGSLLKYCYYYYYYYYYSFLDLKTLTFLLKKHFLIGLTRRRVWALNHGLFTDPCISIAVT